jgi:hypothetical protein
VARRSINDAAKVFLAAFVLGPPIGGVASLALSQVVPLFATGFAGPVPEVGNILKSLALMLPLSYLVGGMAAGLAGLALAAYVSWGNSLTLWACLAASLIYPAILGVSGLLAANESSVIGRSVLTQAAVLAVASLSSALICYLLLRNTKLVQASGDRPQGTSP